MKESNFYSDDFEELIRGKTEQYKMYPSERVWKGVHNSLHTKRKWFIGSMSLLVVGILFMAGKELIAPSHAPLRKPFTNTLTADEADVTKAATAESIPHAPLAAAYRTAGATNSSKHGDSGSTRNEEPDQSFRGLSITLSHPVIIPADISELLSRAVRLPDHAPALTVIAARLPAEQGTGKSSEDGIAERTDGSFAGSSLRHESDGSPAGRSETREAAANSLTEEDSDPLTAHSVLESLSAQGVQNARYNKGKGSLARTMTDRTSVRGGTLKDSAAAFTRASSAVIGENSDRQRINWLHDYALNILPAPSQQPRTYLQLILSPTVNYRTLSGGEFAPSKFEPNGPVAIWHPGDAQRYVDHSPALGFEVGGSLVYRVTRNLSVKAGLQFNFSRYKINAYASQNPQQATINLNSYYGYYMDSVTNYTNLGNFGGNKQTTINNDYYQLSAPIGFELRVLGNERLTLNIGGSIQPSYLLNTNSYMLTSDYTGYTKQPSLLRRWNLSAGLETFLSYRLPGGMSLQAGPEFRYQILSTYTSQYPITENLKGYGLKIGITKALP
jgi:hypothetical protein